MKFKILITNLFLLTIFSDYSNAQNARFSQIYNAPVMLNPALSGRFIGTGRIGSLISWQNSTTTSMAHQNIYGEIKLFSEKNKKNIDTTAFNVSKEKNYFSLTLNHYQYGNDILGFTQNVTPVKAQFTSVTGAYHLNLTKDGRYYAGFGGQITNANATLDENIGTAYDQEISGGGFRYRKTTQANFKSTKGYFDIAAGLYLGFQTDEHLLEMGFAAYHLTQPENDLTGDTDSKLRRRFSAYTNAYFKASPNTLLLFRNTYWEEGIYQASSNYKDSAYITAFYSGLEVINTQPQKNVHVNFGLMTRNFQSAIPSANVFLGNQLTTKLTYEVPFNKSIHPANNAYRFEIFLGYNFNKMRNEFSARNRKNFMW
jgi:hypothetical protein